MEQHPDQSGNWPAVNCSKEWSLVQHHLTKQTFALASHPDADDIAANFGAKPNRQRRFAGDRGVIKIQAFDIRPQDIRGSSRLS